MDCVMSMAMTMTMTIFVSVKMMFTMATILCYEFPFSAVW